ncbi:MAG: hypothetical protein KDK99_15075 [Verrucomicrobiales bacterium]|nr:hypothetical protein [Verrucomicrobiales bacterium]
MAITLAGMPYGADSVNAQDEHLSATAGLPRGNETQMDVAGDVSKYFGQRQNLYRDPNRKLAKIDVDGDFNYDGTINNFDPADNGAFQQTPPGLVVGVGELTRVVVRLTPYKIDYEGRAKVRLEVTGINRDAKSGEFDSDEERRNGMGHIIVWDTNRETKLIDTRDPERLSYEWTIDDRVYPYNLQIVPRAIYVEGVSPSPRYQGDIRLLMSVTDENPNYLVDPKANPVRVARFFRPTYDHILLTVTPTPQEKRYINANAEKVWSRKGDTMTDK